ncbi:MAG: ABC transporter ATP-binding protein [Acidobacteria bacterium]|nr:MAG: ABC transporter ATP-binding protein [Acidobacteriota bacterium]
MRGGAALALAARRAARPRRLLPLAGRGEGAVTRGGAPEAARPLLVAEGLEKSFVARGGLLGSGARVPAVRGVSLSIGRGQTVALVGESGSGKTTTARLLLRLVRPDGGRIEFDGVDWLALPPRELNRMRRQLGVVFQDPATSLNPRMSVEAIVGEPLAIHRLGSRAERRRRVRELLEAVGLPESCLGKRPSEFSGGQRQRIGIARALATAPKLVVLDEPVSALDVSVRAQVLNLLLDLQRAAAEAPAYLFIGHDLAVVRQIADRTAVMYLGRVVEEGPTLPLFASPLHPYTALLRASEPRDAPGAGRPGPAVPAGEPPSPSAPPPGCAFHPRCPAATAECRASTPPLLPREEDPERLVACFHPLLPEGGSPRPKNFSAVPP